MPVLSPRVRRNSADGRSWRADPIAWPFLVVAVVVLVYVTLDVRLGGPLTHVDARLSDAVAEWRLRYRTWPRRGLTVLLWPGQRGVVVVVGLLLMAWLGWTRRRIAPILRFVLALIGVAAVVYAGKFVVDRPAPSGVALGLRHGASYPSGHLANAVLLWGVLDDAVRRCRTSAALRRTVRVLRILAPIAVLVGMTLLNYHWLSDFLGGAAAGVLVLWVVLLPVWDGLAHRIDRRLGWPSVIG